MNLVIAGGHVVLGIWLRRRQNQRRFLDPDQKSNQTPEGNTHLGTINRLSTCLPDLKTDPILPEPLDSSQCIFIDDPLQLAAVAARLTTSRRLALDIEHHSTHTYYGQSCTIQLSDGREDFIIDLIALRPVIASTLGPMFSDPGILKVVHGGGSDVLWLLRDFGIRLINIFDTEKCCQVLGHPPNQRSLKYLLDKFVGVKVDKTLQMADWRQRPLSKEMMEYARSDVHWLLYIADCLGKELMSGNGGGVANDGQNTVIKDPESLLGRAVHRSQSLSLVEYSAPLPRVAASAAAAGIMKNHIAALRALHTSSSSACNLTPAQTTLETSATTHDNTNDIVLPSITAFDDDQIKQIHELGVRVHAVCLWRDNQARKLDEGVTCVLPDDVILTLAEQHYAKTLKRVADVRSFLENFNISSKNSNKYATACKFPKVALQDAATIVQELKAAGAGHRPWAHPEVLAAIKPSSILDTAAKRRHEDPEAFKERLGERFGVKKQVYENCRMLSKSGDLLCFTDKKRLLWYIKKGLAVEVEPGKEPLTVQLTFDHKDDDQKAGAHEFYSSARTNTCVACGFGKHYLRYRVVPVCYRRALPEKFKSHRSHDVLLLCVGCHEIAQRASEQMKREISIEYGIPLFPRLAATTANGTAGTGVDDDQNIAFQKASNVTATVTTAKEESTFSSSISTMTEGNTLIPEALHPFTVRKAAIALDRGAASIPASRKQELEHIVSSYARAVEPWLQDTPPDAPFTQDELWAGLLSGMSKPTRRKAIRRWIAQGHEEQLPVALLKELDISGTEGCNTGVDARDGMGHSWHGQQVIEAAKAKGGDDALSALCARFRQAFIEALNPKYLPAGWKVDHTAPRTFGEHSIYTPHTNGLHQENGNGIVKEDSDSDDDDDDGE